jgi:hypothetical protein
MSIVSETYYTDEKKNDNKNEKCIIQTFEKKRNPLVQ